MLRNSEVVVLAMFSKHVGILECNEAEVLAISIALQIFVPHFHIKFFFFNNYFHIKLILESDSMNAVSS